MEKEEVRYCINCGVELDEDDDELCKDCYFESQQSSQHDFDAAMEDDVNYGEI